MSKVAPRNEIPTMRTAWLANALDDLTAYLWAPFVGIVAGVAFGWMAGVTVTLAFAATLYGVGRLAKRVIAKSLETKVTHRRTGRRPHSLDGP